jgi:hypothetical protein
MVWVWRFPLPRLRMAWGGVRLKCGTAAFAHETER